MFAYEGNAGMATLAQHLIGKYVFCGVHAYLKWFNIGEEQGM